MSSKTTKNAKSLPKTASQILNGGLYLQGVRCGKPNCKCARGELHTAYYFFTRRRGKLTKTYVRKADVEEFSRLVEESAERRSQVRYEREYMKDLFRRLREQNRRSEAVLKQAKEYLKQQKIRLCQIKKPKLKYELKRKKG